MSTSNDSFIASFQQLQLTSMQDNLKHNSPDALARLREQYTKMSNNSELRLEQILLALPLFLLTQTKPEHMKDFEYCKLLMDVDQTMDYLRSVLEKFYKKE
jgi:hypothetical protein